MTTIDWMAMTDQELTEAQAELDAEQRRRATIAGAEARQNALNQEVLAAEGFTDGDPWRQPVGAHDAYPVRVEVTHNGSRWSSLTPGNVWEPGVSGWVEVTDGPAPWLQPTGAHDAYPAGAEVTHAGAVWSSDLPDNVWEPGVYGWTWVRAA